MSFLYDMLDSMADQVEQGTRQWYGEVARQRQAEREHRLWQARRKIETDDLLERQRTLLREQDEVAERRELRREERGSRRDVQKGTEKSALDELLGIELRQGLEAIDPEAAKRLPPTMSGEAGKILLQHMGKKKEVDPLVNLGRWLDIEQKKRRLKPKPSKTATPRSEEQIASDVAKAIKERLPEAGYDSGILGPLMEEAMPFARRGEAWTIEHEEQKDERGFFDRLITPAPRARYKIKGLGSPGGRQSPPAEVEYDEELYQ